MPAPELSSTSTPPLPQSGRRRLLQAWFFGGLSLVIAATLLLAGTLWQSAAGPLAIFALVVFGIGAAAALRLHLINLRALRELANQVRRMRDFDFKTRPEIDSREEIGRLALEIGTMQAAFDKKFDEVNKANERSERLLEEVIPIGVELMTEKDFDGLLERMLRLAQSFCGADGGTLYLKTDDNQLRFEIIHTDSLGVSMGGISEQKITFPSLPMYHPETGEPNYTLLATYVALSGETYNFPGTTGTGRFHEQVRHSVLYDAYRIHSMLTIPLKNPQQQVLGVMQLINAQDPETGEPIGFDQNLQRWMESFSFLAVAALEAYIRERQLKNEIEHLRFEVDIAKRERQVEEIVESDYFKRISAYAEEMRRRKKGE